MYTYMQMCNASHVNDLEHHNITPKQKLMSKNYIQVYMIAKMPNFRKLVKRQKR